MGVELNLNIDEIKKMYVSGVSIEKIALNFNCSNVTVLNRLKLIGVNTSGRFFKTKKDLRILKSMYKKGFSTYYIAKRFGCGRDCVSDSLKRLDVKLRIYERYKLKENIDVIISMRNNGKTLMEIASFFNVTFQAIDYQIRKYNQLQ